MSRAICCPETETAPAVYLVDANEPAVTIEIRGELHRLTWEALHAAADQVDNDDDTIAVRDRYRAVRQAALRSFSPTARRAGAITSLVEDGRRLRDRSDVVGEEQVAQTLDMLIGRWVDGRWVGGHAAIVGTWSAR